jgi:L-ascorbate metabolism protein UlaG (beta-lactamase superfamily)
MKLTYLYHSGFVLESALCTIIFDYYKDSDDNYTKRSLTAFSGKLYVFSSHWHPDHFNAEILKWKDIRPDTEYILSKDIQLKKKLPSDVATFLDNGDVLMNENIGIKTFGSTDAGVSFLIETEGKKIFHAGDLNNWHWDEESTPEEIQTAENDFLRELKVIANDTNRMDLVMFPVDCRLGKNYMRGAEQFVDAIQTDVFVPMHFGQTYSKANAFRPYAEKAGSKFIEWSKTGESIYF